MTVSYFILNVECLSSKFCLFLLEITVAFDNISFTAYENNGIVQVLVTLSNPSSFNETVQVINTDITANGT